MKRRATRLEQDFFTIVELAEEVRREGYHARFGFTDVDRYLEDRIGLSYRSIRKRCAALEAIRALPAEEQEKATAALAGLGASKAAIVAPAIRQDPAGWQDWVQKAAASSVEACQARVSKILGHRPRGPHVPGDRFLRMLLNQIPPDARDEVASVFEAGKAVAGSANAVDVFLRMIAEVKVEWLEQKETAS